MANNELTLVLETEIEKLTPKLIAFNNKELMESVVNTLQNYEGIVYTDKQIGEAKKDRAKKRKQKETYKQNKHGYSQEQYDEFLDLLSDVYDEVGLMFYDSDQVMQMIDDDNFSYEDIVNLLIGINKEKEKELTDVERKLAKKRKKHLSREEQQETTDEVAQMIYLASKSNMTPEQWYLLKHNDPITYQDRLLTIIPKNERSKYL